MPARLHRAADAGVDAASVAADHGARAGPLAATGTLAAVHSGDTVMVVATPRPPERGNGWDIAWVGSCRAYEYDDLILVQVLRQWHERDNTSEWPEVTHPGIAAALREIHENPHRRWTVGRLSEIAGMPRTAFSKLFTTVVGQPPMSYLTGWRLSRAARLLRETNASLASIAPQVGYSTEFAFSAAFRRVYGVSPGRFRSTSLTRSPVGDTPDAADVR